MKYRHLKPFTFFLITLFLLAASLVQAAGSPEMITTDELKKKIDAGEPLLLINALSPIEHDELHIAGSINIPSSQVKADNPKLPADKSKLLIFYCKGPKCSKSRKAAKIAMDLGYTNVLVYNEGLPAWAKRGYPLAKNVTFPKVKFPRLSPKEVLDQADGAVLLDIRGEEVKAVGRIKGAVGISLDRLNEEYGQLPKDKKIIIIDHAGKQVNICGKFLHMNGYADIAVMDGGMLAWKRAGLPVE